MRIRRKYNSTGINTLLYDVATDETTSSYLFKVKIQVKFIFWITIKIYYIDVVLDKIKY